MKNFILLFFIANIYLQAQVDVPKLTQYATDFTNTISQNQIQQLNNRLKIFEDSTSNQLVVLLIPSLEGNAIEEVAHQIATENKIGTKEKENGVLFLISKNDRQVRIEVGYGLEGALPDAISSSIIRNEVIPHFRQGDFASGVFAGVNGIILATAGEYTQIKRDDKKGTGIPFNTIIFIIIFILSTLMRGKRRRGIFLGGMGGLGGSGGGFGGGGFGGFSGGGGGFGGGGASGRW